MARDMGREAVERVFDTRVMGGHRRPGPEAHEPGGTLPVVGKQAVSIGAKHASVGRDRAFRRTVGEVGKRTAAIRTLRHAHMHLVARERSTVDGFAAYRLEPFF